MTHAEALIMTAGLEDELQQALLDGALLCLSFGPAPLTELVRVLAQHLETARLGIIRSGICQLAATGRLELAGGIVSPPSGRDTRETEEQR